MARAIWSGSISFGLVTIPVQLYSALEDKDVHFHLLTKDGRSRLREKLYRPDTNKDYDRKETVRGFEIAPEQYVLVEQEDLDKLRPKAGRTIDIEDFVSLDEIDPIYYDRPYYVVPDERGAKAFRLLVEAMRASRRVAIARFVMRNKEYLAALRIYRNRLCLETMHFADEIRAIEELGGEVEENVKADKREVKLAQDLVEALSGRFEPEKYKNSYRERVLELVESKARGQEVHIAESAPPQPTNVVDLMDVLKESLKNKKKKVVEEHKKGARRSGGSAPKRRAAR